jgi:hypothetical protein
LPEIRKTYECFGMLVSDQKDVDGRVLWVVNIGGVDVGVLSKLTPQQTLTMVFLVTLTMSLNVTANTLGVTVVQDIEGLSLWAMKDAIAKEVKQRMDQLSMGATAVKMKKVCVVGESFWMSAIFGLMKFFMSKKIRSVSEKKSIYCCAANILIERNLFGRDFLFMVKREKSCGKRLEVPIEFLD